VGRSVNIQKGTMESTDLIAVSTFRSSADAQAAKGRLDVAGIESLMRPEPGWPESDHNTPGAFPKNATTQLLVMAADVDRAREILRGR
jgi:hypothetical protein